MIECHTAIIASTLLGCAAANDPARCSVVICIRLHRGSQQHWTSRDKSRIFKSFTGCSGGARVRPGGPGDGRGERWWRDRWGGCRIPTDGRGWVGRISSAGGCFLADAGGHSLAQRAKAQTRRGRTSRRPDGVTSCRQPRGCGALCGGGDCVCSIQRNSDGGRDGRIGRGGGRHRLERGWTGSRQTGAHDPGSSAGSHRYQWSGQR